MPSAFYILGALPPPLGGVSVYCWRKYKTLQRQGIPVRFFDTRRRMSFLLLIVKCWTQIVSGKTFELEINTSSPMAVFLLTILGIGRYAIFFDHNGSRRFKNSRVLLFIFRCFCQKLKAIKVVNPDLLHFYSKLGGDIYRKTTIETPFIKPLTDEIEEARSAFTGAAAVLLNPGRNIILCSAWQPIDSKDEPDLYGLRDALNIYRQLLPKFPNKRFVLMIGELGTNPLSVEVQAICSELEQYKNFFFISGGVPQWPLLENTRVLLRLTKTDGDAVSIREAMAFGADVVATAVCWRPEGVHLVPLGDIEVAENTVVRMLSNSSLEIS